MEQIVVMLPQAEVRVSTSESRLSASGTHSQIVAAARELG